MVDCTSRNMQELRVYPKYFKHYFCSQHCKSKKNKKKMIEISKPQNIYIEKFFNVYPEESMNFGNDNISIAHTNFIKKYYSKYYDLIEYSLNIHIGDNITQTYANFILKKSKKKKIHDYPVLVV